MALDNSGFTLGGLDEGRGHNARIILIKGTLILDASAETSESQVYIVDSDGTVTVNGSTSGGAALALTKGASFSVTKSAWDNGAEIAATMTFRFGSFNDGVAGAVVDSDLGLATGRTQAITTIKASPQNSKQHGGVLDIVGAHFNGLFSDASASTTMVVAAACQVDGNSVTVSLSQPLVDVTGGAEVTLQDDTDTLEFTLVAYAVPVA